MHAGKRCFLIGNGPSINDQDLLLLGDEITICFNGFYKHPQCKEIGPDYWMTADPDIWRKKEQFLLPIIKAIESNEIVVKLFLPMWGNCHLGESRFLDIHYFKYDQSGCQNSKPIDFCKGIPLAQNVMLVGLMLALYLGCNPIVLLGADHTWWRWNREEYKGKETPHFFKNDYSPISERYSYDLLQSTIYVQKYQYLRLIDYAQRRGFEIYNATPAGELDLFPRIEYECLFPGGMPTASIHDFLSGQPHMAGQLGGAAQKMILEEQYAAALVLIDEALRHNINRSQKILGLNYLRALCLNGLGLVREAINEARYEYICNPDNRKNAVRLLENMGDSSPIKHNKALSAIRPAF
jgi:hypothetical protein